VGKHFVRDHRTLRFVSRGDRTRGVNTKELRVTIDVDLPSATHTLLCLSVAATK